MIRLKVIMIGALPIDLKSVKGGVEAAILNLFDGFSLLNDIDVVHISFIEGIRERSQVNYNARLKIIFLPFKVRIKLLDYLFNNASLKQIVDEEKPDIIHIQESEPHLLRFLRWSKKNIVVTQHGIMKEELKYATGIKNKLKFLFKLLVERYVFPSFKNVIFISDYNRQLYRGNLIRSKLISNSVSPIFFEPHANYDGARNAMIYVGVINKRKNLKLVVEALHQLKELNILIDLHVVGWYKEGDVYYEKEISELIKKYNLGNQIRFYGWLKQSEILKIYEQCQFFILPSLQETLPVSIAEAMALGKIVIASDVGAISEMFVDKDSGFLFKANDLSDLVTLLMSVEENNKINYKEWSTRIRSIALLKYHPFENARKTMEFYRQVLTSVGDE